MGVIGYTGNERHGALGFNALLTFLCYLQFDFVCIGLIIYLGSVNTAATIRQYLLNLRRRYSRGKK